MIPKPTTRLTNTTTKYPAPIYQAAVMQPYSLTPGPEEWEMQDRLVAGATISNIADPVGLGVDELKRASEIWQSLIKRFEKRNEQRIHLADTSLRHEVFDPLMDTMEAQSPQEGPQPRRHNNQCPISAYSHLLNATRLATGCPDSTRKHKCQCIHVFANPVVPEGRRT